MKKNLEISGQQPDEHDGGAYALPDGEEHSRYPIEGVPDLSASVLISARATYRTLERYMQRRAREEGLDLSQFDVLRVLWESDGQPQKIIAEITGISESATAQVIHKMEREDLIRRLPDPEDGRRKRVYLTQKSRDMRDHILGIVKDGYARATEGLSESESHTYIALSERIRGNFARMLETDFAIR